MPGGRKTWGSHRVTTEIMCLMGLIKVGLSKEVALESVPDRKKPGTAERRTKEGRQRPRRRRNPVSISGPHGRQHEDQWLDWRRGRKMRARDAGKAFQSFVSITRVLWLVGVFFLNCTSEY